MRLGDIQRLLQLERLQKAEIQQRGSVQSQISGGLRRRRGSTGDRLQKHLHQRTAITYSYSDAHPATYPHAYTDTNPYTYAHVIFS
jgi:hypothetical protein